ncbi:MAG: hypothetical protein PHP17_05020 [Candidatus Omnitrophica bacterium]|nr:hypothetical protein [Candidatus Omnitrophota bacterium]
MNNGKAFAGVAEDVAALLMTLASTLKEIKPAFAFAKYILRDSAKEKRWPERNLIAFLYVRLSILPGKMTGCARIKTTYSNLESKTAQTMNE